MIGPHLSMLKNRVKFWIRLDRIYFTETEN